MIATKIVLGLLACVLIASGEEINVPAEQDYFVVNTTLESDNYIVGGQNARPGQFPFMVSLRTRQNRHFCGASILNNRWVLSAAHCTQGKTAEARNVLAVLGGHLQTDGVTCPILRIINHPRYNRQFMLNDISLLNSVHQFQFIERLIQPLRLPNADYTDGQRVQTWVAGWGLTRVSIFDIV